MKGLDMSKQYVEVETRGSDVWFQSLILGPVDNIKLHKCNDIVKQSIDLKEAGFTAEEVFKLLRKLEE